MTLSIEAELFRRLLTGDHSVPRQPAIHRLSPKDLGDLAPYVWSRRDADVSCWMDLFMALRDGAPAFTQEAAIAAISVLCREAEVNEQNGDERVFTWMLEAAGQITVGYRGDDWEAIVFELRKLVTDWVPERDRSLAIAVLSCAGFDVPRDGDEFVDREREFVTKLRDPRDRILAGRACDGWLTGVDDEELSPRGEDPLALLPGYLDVAEQIVRAAQVRIRAIHAGEIADLPPLQ